MPTLTTDLGPVTGTERINALDILRGIALLGILLMNITGFGLVYPAYNDPTINGGYEGWNLYSWIATNMLFEGTMRAMFSMLFGVGMVLMTSRMEQKGGGIEIADIYYRRTIWLLIFGLIHGYLILWVGDILYAYGLFGLFLFPFRHTAPKKLIIATVVLTLAGIALFAYQYNQQVENYESYLTVVNQEGEEELSREIMEGKGAWIGALKNMKLGEEAIQDEMDEMHKGYYGVMMHLSGINRFIQSIGAYDGDPWDILPMMLLGIAFYKLKIITGELANKSYLLMVIIGYGIGLAVNYYEVNMILSDDFSITSQMKARFTYPVGRIAMAIGHIGLIMLFCKSGILRFLQKSLAAVGRMALTNYIMHSVICAIIFTGVGFGWFGYMQRYELYYVVFAIWVFQMIASPIWLKYYKFGPLEWLWRSLTYRKKQPFKRVSV